MSSGKLYIKTYGCQMNEYDSQKIGDLLLQSHGLSQTPRPEEAQVILLNTCSVREKAQEKLFSELGRLKKLKIKNPDLLIGVGGCVASQEGAELLKRAPFVDVIFGPQTLHRLPHLLDQARAQKKTSIDIEFPEIEKFDYLPQPRAEGPMAYVSIMEGCSKYCSFCIVPYTRGEEVSRPFDDVLSEVSHLADQGVKEICFLGQNVNEYRGLQHDASVARLSTLVHYVASIEGIQRICFMTSHPAAFSHDLIEAYASEPKLMNHLHLPVQSGSDRILFAMKRGYTALEYKSKIRRLRAVRPNISISSDFIVGFPGETETDFRATLNLIEAVGFDTSFSFIYSQRPGTPASAVPDSVPPEEKKERLHRLQAALSQQAQRITQDMLGTQQSVLVTRIQGRTACGRTENKRNVYFEASADQLGSVLSVSIERAQKNVLYGRSCASS